MAFVSSAFERKIIPLRDERGALFIRDRNYGHHQISRGRRGRSRRILPSTPDCLHGISKIRHTPKTIVVRGGDVSQIRINGSGRRVKGGTFQTGRGRNDHHYLQHCTSGNPGLRRVAPAVESTDTILLSKSSPSSSRAE